ncbi:MAG: hypothetical protein K2W96_14705 [Gemmataceae bacterium]|nr:hypothetical protein [Gemmataceae bacterium]
MGRFGFLAWAFVSVLALEGIAAQAAGPPCAFPFGIAPTVIKVSDPRADVGFSQLLGTEERFYCRVRGESYFYDLVHQALRGPFQDGKRNAHLVHIAPDGTFALGWKAGADHSGHSIVRYDAKAGKASPRPGEMGKLRFVNFHVSPDGLSFAGCQPKGGLERRSLATGKPLVSYQDAGPHAEPNPRCFSPDGRLLVASFRWKDPSSPRAGARWHVGIWDAASGRLLQCFLSVGTTHYRLSPDGRRLYAFVDKLPFPDDYDDSDERREPMMTDGMSAASSALLHYEVASGKEVCRRRLPCRFPKTQLSIASDGRFVAWWTALGDRKGWEAGPPKVVTLADAWTGQPFKSWMLPECRKIDDLAFIGSGSRLATSAEGEIHLWDLARFHKRPAAQALGERALAALWDDLASDDIAKARAAVRALADRPAQAAKLLGPRLHPVPRATPAEIDASVRALDSDIQRERNAASSHLAALNEATGDAVRKALAAKPSAEAKRRLDALLRGMARPVTVRDRLRVLRAMEALENAGGKEALALLEKMAGGMPGSIETEEARASVARLEKAKPR